MIIDNVKGKLERFPVACDGPVLHIRAGGSRILWLAHMPGDIGSGGTDRACMFACHRHVTCTSGVLCRLAVMADRRVLYIDEAGHKGRAAAPLYRCKRAPLGGFAPPTLPVPHFRLNGQSTWRHAVAIRAAIIM